MLVKLFAVSLASRTSNRLYFPDLPLFIEIVDFALGMLASRVAVNFNKQNNLPRFVLPNLPSTLRCKKATSPFECASALLDILKSFEGDQAMMRWVAAKPVSPVETKLAGESQQTMPLHHCLDQHTTPSMAYWMPMGVAETSKNPKGEMRPFRGLKD